VSAGAAGPSRLDPASPIGLLSSGNASDQLQSPDLPALSDVVSHTPSLNDIAVQIQVLEATPKIASITLDGICHAQAADDSLRPVLQALKDQAKPPHSGICQTPEDARMLLSQWNSLDLQDDIMEVPLPGWDYELPTNCLNGKTVTHILNGFMPTLDTLDGPRLTMQFCIVSTFQGGILLLDY